MHVFTFVSFCCLRLCYVHLCTWFWWQSCTCACNFSTLFTCSRSGSPQNVMHLSSVYLLSLTLELDRSLSTRSRVHPGQLHCRFDLIFMASDNRSEKSTSKISFLSAEKETLGGVARRAYWRFQTMWCMTSVSSVNLVNPVSVFESASSPVDPSRALVENASWIPVAY